MAYKYKASESVEAGTRRILIEQCERAEQQLSAAIDTTTGVHEARKCIKRMRALLRLVRGAVGDECWRAESSIVRDVGLRLSPLRDSDVAQQTINALAIDATAPMQKALQQLGALIAQGSGQALDAASRQQVMIEAQVTIAAFRKTCEAFAVPGAMPHVIATGLGRAQRQCRARLQRAREEPTDERLHDLRKAVQAHWRHMLLLSGTWPDLMKARADEARALSVLLGEDQDLAMLERLTEAAVDKGLRHPDAARIATACRKRRKALQKEALARADRLFLEKPRRFAAQIARAWTIAAQIKGEASKQQVGKNM